MEEKKNKKNTQELTEAEKITVRDWAEKTIAEYKDVMDKLGE